MGPKNPGEKEKTFEEMIAEIRGAAAGQQEMARIAREKGSIGEEDIQRIKDARDAGSAAGQK